MRTHKLRTVCTYAFRSKFLILGPDLTMPEKCEKAALFLRLGLLSSLLRRENGAQNTLQTGGI